MILLDLLMYAGLIMIGLGIAGLISKLKERNKPKRIILDNDKKIVSCRVKSKQFIGRRDKFYWLEQDGIFKRDEMIFYGNEHKIYFKDIQQFMESVIKIYD